MILIAPNSFKNACSNKEAAHAIYKGIEKANLSLSAQCLPIADGGDDTMSTLVEHFGGFYRKVSAHDPLMRSITCTYGILFMNSKKIAVIEMSSVSGLKLLQPKEYNPFVTTTYGVGELLQDAASQGCDEILLCIGGSATNDGGMGMATALGYEFLDERGESVSQGASSLPKIKQISTENAAKWIPYIPITILADVKNTLCGKNGASFVYGQQKGAKEEDLEILDRALFHFANCLERTLDRSFLQLQGGGAAGGLGVGSFAFLHSTMKNGAEVLLDMLSLDSYFEKCSLVITGEGMLDSQSFYGKAPYALLKRAQQRNIPVIALCGGYQGEVSPYLKEGFAAIFSIQPGPITLCDAIKNTTSNLSEMAQNIANLYHSLYRK